MMRKSMPTTGSSWAELKAEMAKIAEHDADWRSGRTAVYVFNAGDDVLAVAADAYRLFLSENALGARRAFPSLARMESDVVQFGLSLLNAPEAAVGDMTSGGTESIMLAVKACRDYWRARGRDVGGGEILAPQSAHPAFDKAASDRWEAFMDEKGNSRLFEISNAANRRSGAAANVVFAAPAHTIRGATEKMKIARLASGIGEGSGTGDVDLAAFQDNDAPWIDNAIADLERLA